MVRPIAVLLRPSEQVSASQRLDYEKVALKLYALRSEGKTAGLLLFVGSIVVLLGCFVLSKLLEDDDENTGFWPDDPKH